MEINLNEWKSLFSITETITIEGTKKSFEVINQITLVKVELVIEVGIACLLLFLGRI